VRRKLLERIGVSERRDGDLRVGDPERQLVRACAVAVPSQKDACTKSLSSLHSEKVTIKDVSYTVSHVGSDTAEVKLRITACEAGHCDASSSNTGELVKQNGNWYVSNSTGGFGNSGNT
jgi:hypothetical protein